MSAKQEEKLDKQPEIRAALPERWQFGITAGEGTLTVRAAPVEARPGASSC